MLCVIGLGYMRPPLGTDFSEVNHWERVAWLAHQFLALGLAIETLGIKALINLYLRLQTAYYTTGSEKLCQQNPPRPTPCLSALGKALHIQCHMLSGKAYKDLDSTVVIVIFLLTLRYINSGIHHGCRVWEVESSVLLTQCVHAINEVCDPHIKCALIWTGHKLAA